MIVFNEREIKSTRYLDWSGKYYDNNFRLVYIDVIKMDIIDLF